MTARVIGLYGQPDDPEEWDRYYSDVHMPIARKIPGLQALRVSRVLSALDGSEAPYSLVAQVSFDNMQALQSALNSPEGQETAEDYARIAPPGSMLLIVEDLET